MAKKFKTIEIKPDYLYNNLVVAKFINQVMQKGKKNLARKIVYAAFDIIKKQTSQDPVSVFEKAMDTVGPTVEVRPRRVGGATYQVPMEVKDKRRVGLAMRWLILGARAKKGKTMEEKLAQELMMASKGEGEAVKKRINVEKMAAANRAFAHLAR